MAVFYNPSSPQLGAEVALASGLLLPELFQMEFGAREAATEAPVVLLAAPEMAPKMELARELELEPAMALEIAQSGQWVLSFQPLASFAVADLLTWLGNVSPEALAALASPEEELLLVTKAQKQDLELAPFAGFSCGLKERKTWPFWFAPFRVTEIWPELLIGEDERRLAR